jgi:endonuclease/exonuclease/phosphatase family metal-dependent hydrolase
VNLRLLAWNVHGLPAPLTRKRRARLRRIAAQVAREAPDLVTFEEAWGGSVRLLCRELPSYLPFFVRAPATVAAGGLLCLVRDNGNWRATARPRFRRYSLQAPAWKLWQGDGAAGKGALFVALDGPGGPLCLAATHLQSRYPGQPYRQVRVAQLRELARWMDEIGAATPILVCGDLNTPATDEEYPLLVAPLGTDLTTDAQGTGAVTNYPTRSSAAWIDYAIARLPRNCSARSSTRLILNDAADEPYSDHHGLVVDIEITGAGRSGESS